MRTAYAGPQKKRPKNKTCDCQVRFNGAASALAYFALPAFGHDPAGKAIKAAICCTSATLAVVGYLTAEWAQHRTKATL